MDIREPIHNDMLFDLPPKAQRLYDKMHRDSVLELKDLGAEVTGVNAGAVTMKCRQLASGFVKDDDGTWHTVHSAKLDVLDELREKLQGAPLLVAYWFKEDVKAIMAHYKDAVVLPTGAKQGEVEDQWNAGKIPLLLIQPQSAGHGLNLQFGGNNICFYTSDWNAEYYEQAIGRIGPTRQMQAGFNRPVYVHRIIAAGTWEHVVAQKVDSKMSVSEAVAEVLAQSEY